MCSECRRDTFSKERQEVLKNNQTEVSKPISTEQSKEQLREQEEQPNLQSSKVENDLLQNIQPDLTISEPQKKGTPILIFLLLFAVGGFTYYQSEQSRITDTEEEEIERKERRSIKKQDLMNDLTTLRLKEMERRNSELEKELQDQKNQEVDLISKLRKSEEVEVDLMKVDPVWVISISAQKSENQAKKYANKVRREYGVNTHIAWIPDYPSTSQKPFWIVYIGPYDFNDRVRVKNELQFVKSKIEKGAYGIKMSQQTNREDIK